MRSLAVALVFAFPALYAAGQTTSPPSSDPQAILLARQSIAALTGGTVVRDVTISANVISILGSDYETGTSTFQAKVPGESRSVLNLSGGTRIDVRSVTPNGIPIGAWERNGNTPTPYAQHNCWNDASWFFPALSSLRQNAFASFVFRYIGQEQHNGVSVQHIQVFQVGVNHNRVLQRLSTADFYLDASSYLPLAIAFNSHADDDLYVDIPTEIEFANYQSVNGVQVPFHFQKLLNGFVVLDATVTKVLFNTGLADSLFSLQ